MLLYESEQKYLKKIRNNNRVNFFLLQSTLLFYILETFCYHLRMRHVLCTSKRKGLENLYYTSIFSSPFGATSIF
jgi:hypothetical protein